MGKARNRLVLRGLPVKELGRRWGIHPHSVYGYIYRHGLKGKHRESIRYFQDARVKYKADKKQTLEEIAGLILGSLIEKMDDIDRWSYEKALMYRHRHPNYQWELETLARFYSRYKIAVDDGHHMNLTELGEEIGVMAPMAGKLLREVGLKPLNKPIRFTRLSKREKDILARAYYTALSYSDIAYFTGIKYDKVKQNLPRWFGKKPKTKPLKHLGFYGTLTAKKADEIFYGQDVGFSLLEITELLSETRQLVEYAIKHREELSKRIQMEIDKIYAT